VSAHFCQFKERVKVLPLVLVSQWCGSPSAVTDISCGLIFKQSLALIVLVDVLFERCVCGLLGEFL
jgi:hypothetical protein